MGSAVSTDGDVRIRGRSAGGGRRQRSGAQQLAVVAEPVDRTRRRDRRPGRPGRRPRCAAGHARRPARGGQDPPGGGGRRARAVDVSRRSLVRRSGWGDGPGARSDHRGRRRQGACAALWLYWDTTAQREEARTWLEALLASGDTAAPTSVRAAAYEPRQPRLHAATDRFGAASRAFVARTSATSCSTASGRQPRRRRDHHRRLGRRSSALRGGARNLSPSRHRVVSRLRTRQSRRGDAQAR